MTSLTPSPFVNTSHKISQLVHFVFILDTFLPQPQWTSYLDNPSSADRAPAPQRRGHPRHAGPRAHRVGHLHRHGGAHGHLEEARVLDGHAHEPPLRRRQRRVSTELANRKAALGEQHFLLLFRIPLLPHMPALRPFGWVDAT